jgi:hypothetical protein
MQFLNEFFLLLGRQRSKSAISDEISTFKENERNYPLRRQSAIGDFKPKVSD